MTERVKVTGDQRVAGQKTENMPGDPARLPEQSTYDWLAANGETGLINATPHWCRGPRGARRPKPAKRPVLGEQLDIDSVLSQLLKAVGAEQ